MAAFRYLVPDVDRAVDFYCRFLGFSLEKQFGPAMAIVRREDLALWLAGPSSSAARPMPDGRRIVFVPVRSQYGVVNLAMVRKAPLPEQMAATLAHALLGAIDPVA